MDFQQIGKLQVPNDFTGNRLVEITVQILETWPTLTLAFHYNTHQFTNQTQKEVILDFAKLISAFIINLNVKQQDLEEFLVDYMDHYFKMIIDDGTEIFIAQKLIALFEDLEKKSLIIYNQIKNEIQLFKQMEKPQHSVVQEQEKEYNIEDNEEEDEMEEEDEEDQIDDKWVEQNNFNVIVQGQTQYKQEKQQMVEEESKTSHQNSTVSKQKEEPQTQQDDEDDGFETVIEKKRFQKKAPQL